MTFKDQVSTALSNVGRRKLRSALASLGVVVGVVTIVVMVSLANGVRQQINNQFASIGLDRLTVNSSGRQRANFGPFGMQAKKKLITPQEVRTWKALPGVKQVIPEVYLARSVEMELVWNNTNQPVTMPGGGDFRPGGLFQEIPKPVAGTLDLPETGGIILSEGAIHATGFQNSNYSKIIGQSAEAILKTSRGEHQAFTLKVVGVSQEQRPVIQVSLTDRIAMKNWWFNSTNILDRDGYDSVTIRTADVPQANKVSAELRKQGYDVQSIEVIMDIANRIVTVITLMFTLIGSIALLVAAIGIANTTVMAVYERTREIGILKAMGASNGEIRHLFMLEAGFIGMIGGVIGVLIGWLIGLGLNPLIAAYGRWRNVPVHGDFFVISATIIISAITFATIIGLVAGVLPSERAAKLNPLEALRHE